MDETGREPVEELTLEPARVVRNGRPRALWAAIAAVGLATGALVVTSSDDDGGSRPGLPVALAFGGSGGGEAAAADASRLAWVTYVAGDDLPTLGGEGTAYRLTGDVDEARVRALAEAVGLDGELRRTEGGWSITGEGGLGRLEVGAGGGAFWTYFGGHQDCVTEDGSIGGCYAECELGADGAERCAKPLPAQSGGSEPTTTTIVDGGVAVPPGVACAAPAPGEEPADCDAVAPDTGSDCVDDDCIAPDQGADPPVSVVEPPEPVTPPEDVARVALDVVAAAGLDVEDAIVTGVEGGTSGEDAPDVWFVTVEPKLDGVPSGLLSFVEVGPDLAVGSGSGVLGGAVDLGGYPLLDTRATIDRANEQTGTMPGIAVEDAGSSAPGGAGGGAVGVEGTAGGTDGEGSTDVGGGEGPDEPTDTTIVDPCTAPEGAPDGCGGTTGCGGDGCTEPPTEPSTTLPCKVQPDGREICEVEPSYPCEDPVANPVDCPPTECPPYPQAEDGTAQDGTAQDGTAQDGTAQDDIAVGAPEAPSCTPPPDPGPVPDPEPVEIVLVDAERSLVLLPATDGSGDAYLVPAYRFTAEDGGQVDLPAIADEALAGPSSTETTVPGTVTPPPEPLPEPQPCEVLEEGDASGTTHTVQTCPTPNEDPGVLGEGEEPAIGVGYHVDVDKECAGGSFVLGRDTWISEDDAPFTWGDRSDRFEGGTFTLDAPDHGTFVGDADGTKVGEFRTLPPNEDIFCTPGERS